MENNINWHDTTSVYVQALKGMPEYEQLSTSRKQFLETFINLFIFEEYIRYTNKYFADKYLCSEKTIERYFSDLRKNKIIYQRVACPYYDGRYHTERTLWLDPVLRANIQLAAQNIKDIINKSRGKK